LRYGDEIISDTLGLPAWDERVRPSGRGGKSPGPMITQMRPVTLRAMLCKDGGMLLRVPRIVVSAGEIAPVDPELPRTRSQGRIRSSVRGELRLVFACGKAARVSHRIFTECSVVLGGFRFVRV
jgi:hypothetical protein